MSDRSATADVAAVAARAGAVLRDAGIPDPFRLLPIAGGGNNRVFMVASAGSPVVLKAYYRHPGDVRDRLAADYGFSTFAWAVGARALPRPLAADAAAGLAVYEFVAGEKLPPGAVTAAHVAEAAAFFRSVDEHRCDPRAAGLPTAAEACFSIADHVAVVDGRVRRLDAIEATAVHGDEAVALVAGRLRPAWDRLRSHVLAAVGSAASATLADSDRCLSPSDFGFHNAILGTDGRLRFLDFEYAGHDDPAKLVCDFFCQPAVPVPQGHVVPFIAALRPQAPDRGELAARVGLLLPVYRLKWCCIMLNEFMPADDRRRFAGAVADLGARRAAQLAKVAASLDQLGA